MIFKGSLKRELSTLHNVLEKTRTKLAKKAELEVSKANDSTGQNKIYHLARAEAINDCGVEICDILQSVINEL